MTARTSLASNSVTPLRRTLCGLRSTGSRSLTLVALLWLGVATPSASAADGKPIKVVTTFTILADMASRVAGDAATVVSITKPGAEIHNYQPTPQDVVRSADADLVLWNGLNLELWFERFLTRLDGVPNVVLSDGIEPMNIGTGPYDGKPNPHAWMSPSDALVYVDNIRRALTEADPDHGATYDANAEAYSAEIEALVTPLRERLSTIPPARRWLVTSEGAFSYLARDFDLQELYLWPINADAQGTPQQVRGVIDQIREHDIGAIFSESTVSDKPARQVSRETGIHYGGVLFVDSLSDEDGPVPTYLDLLRVTIQTVVDGLQQGQTGSTGG